MTIVLVVVTFSTEICDDVILISTWVHDIRPRNWYIKSTPEVCIQCLALVFLSLIFVYENYGAENNHD